MTQAAGPGRTEREKARALARAFSRCKTSAIEPSGVYRPVVTLTGSEYNDQNT